MYIAAKLSHNSMELVEDQRYETQQEHKLVQLMERYSASTDDNETVICFLDFPQKE